MIPHLQTPTLFPYTTLFRSADDHRLLADVEMTEAADEAHAVHLAGLLLEAPDQQHVAIEAEQVGCAYRSRGGDRKSTRLNSSHLVISYAVFCLKKKNNYCVL